MKKCSEVTQTLHIGCSKAEPKIFVPPQTPFPGVRDGQNWISWRWSLPSPTNPFWWRSMQAISSYRGNRPTNKQTKPQTGPITIHCAAKLSVQCKCVINIKALPCTSETSVGQLPAAMTASTLSMADSISSSSKACIFSAYDTSSCLKTSVRQDRKCPKSSAEGLYQWQAAARIWLGGCPRRINVAWSSACKSRKPKHAERTRLNTCLWQHSI